MNQKHLTLSLGLILLSHTTAAFWRSRTQEISIHTNITNHNAYSDLLLLSEDNKDNRYLLTIVPRVSTWYYDTSQKFYDTGQETYTRTYKIQWSLSPSSSFNLTESVTVKDGEITKASCQISDPTVGICDYIFDTQDITFYLDAR